MRKAEGLSAPRVSAARSGKKRTGAKKPRRAKAPSRPVLRFMAKWLFVLSIWAVIGLFGAVTYLAFSLPAIDEVDEATRQPSMTVLAADGGVIARIGDLNGDAVSVPALPEHMIQAVLAIEDRRFYSHFGIDPRGILRAAIVNYRAGRTVQGGSTITQQLAKILFLSPDRTWERKAQEALLALWLEWSYDKDTLLAAYLNRAYFGGGAYGLDAASRLYFGHPASDVDLREAAILAGLLKAPSRFAPTRSRAAAEARADVVLAAMVDAGYMTEEEVAARQLPAPVPKRRPVTGDGGRYYADWVADELPQIVGDIRQDITIRTTLEPRLQRAAEAAVTRVMNEKSEAAEAGQAALIAMRMDGAVVAMVGGRSYRSTQFNRAVDAWRQPGSAFKPIIYLTALEQGMRPDALVLDQPVEVAGYAPANYGGEYVGQITAREALARSSNSVAVQLMDWVGIDETMATGRRLGLSGEMRRDLSLALGASETNLLELTSAYAVLANGGRTTWPYAVQWVERTDGTTLHARQGDGGVEVARPWHVWELNGMLAEVMRSGTGRRAALDRPSAGKTGTSQDNRDAWFVGFTSDLVVGVWVGNDDNTPMNGVTGGGLPAEIWQAFMFDAHRGQQPKPLPGPHDLPTAGPALVAGEPATLPRDRNPIARFLNGLFGG